MAPATENKSDRLPDLAIDLVIPTALAAKAAIYADHRFFRF